MQDSGHPLRAYHRLSDAPVFSALGLQRHLAVHLSAWPGTIEACSGVSGRGVVANLHPNQDTGVQPAKLRMVELLGSGVSGWF